MNKYNQIIISSRGPPPPLLNNSYPPGVSGGKSPPPFLALHIFQGLCKLGRIILFIIYFLWWGYTIQIILFILAMSFISLKTPVFN